MHNTGWHFVIPFHYGRSMAAGKKGGAPLKKKVEYLKRTINSIQARFHDPRIHLFVCNDQSGQLAASIFPAVEMVDCNPRHLPYQSVVAFTTKYASGINPEDFVVFTEDDQELHVSDSVLDDITQCREDVIFSPHRWARLLLFFRTKKRLPYRLHGQKGVLDNYKTERVGRRTWKAGHTYDVQENRLEAYAACWFARASALLRVDTAVEEAICLETASYVVFDSRLPVLKLSLSSGEKASDFVVNHLSGYDYNKRIFL